MFFSLGHSVLNKLLKYLFHCIWHVTDMDLGPLDRSVLYDQDSHRLSVLWDGGDIPILQCRRKDMCVHSSIRLDRCIVPLV